MCGGGGAPAPPRKNPAPADPPPELLLDAEGAKRKRGLQSRKAKRAGRSSLVTPGLSVGSAASRPSLSLTIS